MLTKKQLRHNVVESIKDLNLSYRTVVRLLEPFDYKGRRSYSKEKARSMCITSDRLSK